MKYLAITPTSMLGVLDCKGQDDVGARTHVMVLAHLLKGDKEYGDFWLRTRSDREFFLLDNGIAEAAQLSSEDLLALAIKYQPTVMVAPDTIANGPDTVKKTLAFIELFKAHKSELPNTKLMAVPQGATIDEYLKTFDIFSSNPDIAWLGLSKFMGTVPYIDRVTFLLNEGDRITGTDKEIHLLGCNNPIEVLAAVGYTNIKSIDSCIATLYGINEKPMGLDVGEKKRIPTPEDFFEHEVANVEEIAIAADNIDRFDQLCEVSTSMTEAITRSSPLK